MMLRSVIRSREITHPVYAPSELRRHHEGLAMTLVAKSYHAQPGFQSTHRQSEYSEACISYLEAAK